MLALSLDIGGTHIGCGVVRDNELLPLLPYALCAPGRTFMPDNMAALSDPFISSQSTIPATMIAKSSSPLKNFSRR